jgi:hypothetical protein
VVVYGSMQTETGAETANVKQGSEVDTQCVAQPTYTPTAIGAYAAAGFENSKSGVLVYWPLPQWLASVPYNMADERTQPDAHAGVPVNGAPVAAADKAKVDPVSTGLDWEARMLNCYARAVYVQQTLRERSASLSGPLRFDIAPGSHVKIEGNPELFAEAGEDALASDKYAQVTRVQVSINADRKSAATILQLQYVRNEAENESDRTSAEDHVFFPGAMVKGGLPLSPELIGDGRYVADAKKRDADETIRRNNAIQQQTDRQQQPAANDNEYDQGTPGPGSIGSEYEP